MPVSSSSVMNMHALGRAGPLAHQHEPGGFAASGRRALAIASAQVTIRARSQIRAQEGDRVARAGSGRHGGSPRRPRSPAVIGLSATAGSSISGNRLVARALRQPRRAAAARRAAP